MRDDVRQLIVAIHDSPTRLVYEFAGAGSLALAWLHLVPGSSRTVIEATDRYTIASIVELLGAQPDQVVSEATARAMAERAYVRATHLRGDGGPCLGVACTAAVATDRRRRGRDHAYLAVADGAGIVSSHLDLTGDRQAQEEAVSEAVVRAIADNVV